MRGHRGAVLSKPRRRDDITALVAALGGNASVAAIYDARRNVTASASVSAFGDARGTTGYGPTRTATGSKKPGWDPVNYLITYDGIDDCLLTPLDAMFDISGPTSIVFIGAIQISSPLNAATAAISDAVSFTRSLMVWSGATASGTIQVRSTSGGTADSGVLVGSTMRVAVASKNGSSGPSASVAVPNAVEVFVGTSATGGGSNSFAVGNYFPGGANPSPCVEAASMVLTRRATASDLATILAWASDRHSAIHA